MKYLKLYESYSSQKELEELAKILINHITEKTLDGLDSNIDSILQYKTTMLGSVNPNIFTTIKPFIEKRRNILIAILHLENFNEYCSGEACYLYYKNDEYSNDPKNISHHIFVKEDPYTITKFNEYIKKWDYNNTEDILRDISNNMNKSYHSHLLHELQHAYDDWRSNNKAIRDKSYDYKSNTELYNKYTKNLNLNQNMKEEELDFIAKHHKEYLNLPHEVDARFTQAIKKTDFYELDFDKSFENEYEIYNMLPFEDVKKQFKRKLYPFNMLNDDEKKRVLRKFGQFYELEKEFIKNKNLEKNKL